MNIQPAINSTDFQISGMTTGESLDKFLDSVDMKELVMDYRLEHPPLRDTSTWVKAKHELAHRIATTEPMRRRRTDKPFNYTGV